MMGGNKVRKCGYLQGAGRRKRKGENGNYVFIKLQLKRNVTHKFNSFEQ